MLLMISAHLELMKKTSGFVPTLENIKPAIERAITFSGIECDEDDKKKLLEEIEYREKITHILGDIIYDDYELRNGTSTKLLRIIIFGRDITAI